MKPETNGSTSIPISAETKAIAKEVLRQCLTRCLTNASPSFSDSPKVLARDISTKLTEDVLSGEKDLETVIQVIAYMRPYFTKEEVKDA